LSQVAKSQCVAPHYRSACKCLLVAIGKDPSCLPAQREMRAARLGALARSFPRTESAGNALAALDLGELTPRSMGSIISPTGGVR
jgi:hypothetical protein